MAGAAAGVSFSLKERMNYILKYNQGSLGLFQRITTPQEYYELTGKDDFYDQKVYLRDDARVFVFIMCGLEYEIEDVIYYEHTAVRSDGTTAYSSESGSETEAPDSEPELSNGVYSSESGSETEAPDSEPESFKSDFFTSPEQREQYIAKLRSIAPEIGFLSNLDELGREAYIQGYVKRLDDRDRYIEKIRKDHPHYRFYSDKEKDQHIKDVMAYFDEKDRIIREYMERREQPSPSLLPYGLHVV